MSSLKSPSIRGRHVSYGHQISNVDKMLMIMNTCSGTLVYTVSRVIFMGC